MGAQAASRAPTGPEASSLTLSGHALGQRTATLIAKMDAIGDVTVDDGGVRGSIRKIRVSTIAPGGGLPTTAVFDYEEVYLRASHGDWQLIGYSYEYGDAVNGGRRAYHLHDGRSHAHCVDPAVPGRDHHFRAPEIDAFEAHDEFSRLYAAQRPVRCDDLRPALSVRVPGEA